MDPVLILGITTIVVLGLVLVFVFGDIEIALSRRWEWTKRWIRQYGWFASTGLALALYAGWVLFGGHQPQKWEKVVLLGFPAGVFLFIPFVGWVLSRFLQPDEYWFLRRRADGSPTKIWELNQAAKDRLQWLRREGERLPGTIHPAWSVFDFDEEQLVAEPTYRGFLTGEQLDTAREAIQQQWERIDEEVAAFRQVRRRLSGIVRRLDYQRAAAENAVLDKHRHPSFDGDTIDDVISEEVPDEYLPDFMKTNGKDPLADESDEFDPDEDVLDNVVAAIQSNGSESAQDAARANGGSRDE